MKHKTRSNSGIATTFKVLPTAVFLMGLFLFVGTANAQKQKKPNIIYFLVDNLGMGELSVYSGGAPRGTMTPRIDDFATQGMRLTNFAPESQCTPSRSALMTGRYSIRSGNQSVPLGGAPGGVVTWERTMGDIFSDAGYATAIYGKWHIGESEGRWPTDHGFDRSITSIIRIAFSHSVSAVNIMSSPVTKKRTHFVIRVFA